MVGFKMIEERSQIYMFKHPISILRLTGFVDGLSLLLLLCIAMPLKYWADMPEAVSIVGAAHGFIFIAYLCSIIFAQLRIQWNVGISLLALLVAFIPGGNLALDYFYLKKQHHRQIKPFQKSWIVYCIIFFTFIDLFTQLPVMSTFATSVGATAVIAGFIVGMYSLTNTFGNILSGILTDRIGPLSVLFFGLLTTSLTLSLYNFVDNVQALLVVRFLHGFVGGLVVPAAFALLANITKEEKQGSQSAVTGSFVGIAAILGPAYSGIMASRTSVPFVFTTVAIFGACLILLMVVFLRSVVNKNKKAKEDKVKLSWNRNLIQSYFGAFFLMFSQGALAYLLPLHVQELGYSSRLSGTLMSMFGIVAVLVFVLPTNRMFDRISPIYTLTAGMSFIGISQILIGQMTSQGILYAVLALYGFGFALLFPSINTLLIKSTKPEVRGKAYGYFYAFFSLGTVAGSSGLGLLPFGLEDRFIFTGGLLILIALLLLTLTIGKLNSRVSH